jgi:two-component system NarL family response regulator
LAARLLREFAHQRAGDAKTQQESDMERVALNTRQTEVLRLVASGMTYKEVALKLALSDHTVRYHMSEIMRLLHLENRSQVIAYAGKLGLKN